VKCDKMLFQMRYPCIILPRQLYCFDRIGENAGGNN